MDDPLRLIDVDYVQFYVGNARQAAFFYAHMFGFEIEQVSDLTTGVRDSATYLLTLGNIRFLLTSGLTKEHPASREVAIYGDGIKDIAFTVDDAMVAFETAVKRGAEIAYEPVEKRDERGTVVRAGVKTFGRVVHSFVSRSDQYSREQRSRKEINFCPISPSLRICQSIDSIATRTTRRGCFTWTIVWEMLNLAR